MPSPLMGEACPDEPLANRDEGEGGIPLASLGERAYGSVAEP